MYLNSSTANVLNKFNGQKINILYEPQRNLFDIFLAECGYCLYFDSSNVVASTQKTNMVALNSDQYDLFNYNVGITNNILSYSSNKVFSNLHLNTIIFTHSYKPKNIKREDLLLMSNNMSKEKKVFFSRESADSWDFLTNKSVINYGIPTEILTSEIPFSERGEKVLILNFEGSSHVESIANLMESNGIKVDLIKDMTGDVNAIKELFNRYKVIIELNDHNIINLLAAVSCGCKCITHYNEMISANYSNIPNLFMAKSIGDLISISKNCFEEPLHESTEYIHTNFQFETFKNNIKNIIEQSNNEAFII